MREISLGITATNLIIAKLQDSISKNETNHYTGKQSGQFGS
jgi:hypothetical protein